MNKLKTDLDKIKVNDELKDKTLTYVMNKKKKRNYFVPATAILAVVLLMIIYNVFPKNKEPIILTKEVYSYVSIDINPSLELKLDEEDKIIEVVSYNSKAEEIINEVSLKGQTIQKSIETLITHDKLKKYLKDGYMQVSIYGEDLNHSTQLEAEINNTLSKKLNSNQYGCTHYQEANLEKAQSHHMSFGKYEIIETIISIDDRYQLEVLKQYSMKELKEIYEELTGENLSGHHQGNSQNHRGRNGRNKH